MHSKTGSGGFAAHTFTLAVQESGRYARPEAGQALGEMIRRFHGYR